MSITIKKLFQSTLPARGATSSRPRRRRPVRGFQSTLPARGATACGKRRNARMDYFNLRSPHGERHARPEGETGGGDISIYAPRTGSDNTVEWWEACCKDFNLRSPHGERRVALLKGVIAGGISIYAPRTGSDEKFRAYALLDLISIYAPRTGSDAGIPCAQRRQRHFNLRSPHGERPKGGEGRGKACKFQSTLPARGATHYGAGSGGAAGAISIYAPRTGSDDERGGIAGEVAEFQSTLPARGATTRRRACTGEPLNFNLRSPHGERQAPTLAEDAVK